MLPMDERRRPREGNDQLRVTQQSKTELSLAGSQQTPGPGRYWKWLWILLFRQPAVKLVVLLNLHKRNETKKSASLIFK